MLKRLKKRLETIFKEVEGDELVQEYEVDRKKKGYDDESASERVFYENEEAGKEVKKAVPFLTVKLEGDKLGELLWKIELAMLENNVAEEAASHICGKAKEKLEGVTVRRGEVGDVVKRTVREVIENIMSDETIDLVKIVERKRREGKPALILFFGFNGTGKTTTMAKIAKMLIERGFKVVFAAADTFRAASIEQLEEHASKLHVKVIKHKYGSDPAAVIFDAVKYAESRGVDVVLADTAGRSHADRNLLEELKKIVRVNEPDLRILVLEAIAGNDIVEQARKFEEAGVDGVILTKWDVDERGGAAISVSYVLGKPIMFIGTGQRYDDLVPFNRKKVLDEIIG